MRQKIVLDGVWDFQWFGEEKPEFPMELTDVASVPGCFDVTEPLCGKRGYAVYRKQVQIGGPVKLSIDGLGIRGEVYWDEIPVGTCEYAYMPEEFFFNAGETTSHELTVVIDNRYNEQFDPFFDFYGYGGIYGSVSLEALPRNAVTQLLIATENVQTGLVSIRVKAADGYCGKAWISFDTGGLTECTFADGVMSCEIQVPEFKLWTPAHPYLHTLTLKTETDEVTQTFGIRLFTTRGREILLNGEPVKLVGYNRHESYPSLGAAVPVNMMVSDLKLLKEHGCNFIRGSHYPQRRAFLELCDKMGILVWEETLSWGINPPKLHDPAFLEAQLQQVRTLTVASFHHPCIAIRGFLNENASDLQETRPVIRALYEEIRQIDRHCLISFASYKHQQDVCTDFVDVIAMNAYPGWYDSTYDNISTVDRVRPFLEKLSADMPQDKPFLITEIGAEAIYGFRDPLKTRWSEEYQAELVIEACRFALESEACAGISIWHFADARSYVNGEKVYGRARGFNNKGVLDEYRRPKLAWYALKELIKK